MRALARRLAPRGLRWRLAAWFTLVMVLCTGIVFVAVYRGTGTQVRQQIDRELAGDAAEFAHNLRAAEPGSYAELAGGREGLPPHPALQRELDGCCSSRSPGGRTISNSPELVTARRARRRRVAPASRAPRTAWR